jgi:DNA-binding transcriptional regulator YhcF (GntR family)
MKRATREGHFTNRRREFFVPSIVLDRASEVPLHQQISRQIAQAIRGGAVRNQARLPSTRAMANLLGVSRNTVLAAYDELAADALIRGERGAGMRVNHGASSPEMSWFGLRQVIRAAGYPAKVLALEDTDGNPLYICL